MKKIKILYEDKDILAIDKPSGISVHPAAEQVRYGAGPSGKAREETISDWVLKNYPKAKNVGEPMEVKSYKVPKVSKDSESKKDFQLSTFNFITIARPGIVHRLDKDTSGVLLIAKTQRAFEFLKKQFADREVEKTYLALVHGHVKNDKGVIDAEIGRSKNDPRKRTASRGKRGKLREAVTEYNVLKRLTLSTSPEPSPRLPDGQAYQGEGGNKFTWLEIHPKTGRTHQIRVHMKFLNHPIVCDGLYAPKKSCPAGITRLALHASSIKFKALSGKIIEVKSPLPKELAKVIKA